MLCNPGSPAANGAATVTAPCLAATYAPNANYCGTDSFTYTGIDSGVPQLSDTGTVNVTITCVPDAPVCAGTSVTTPEDTMSPFFSLNCTDADGSLPICSIVTQGTKGTVTISSCLFARYTPNADQTGSDVFTYQASDGLQTSLPATGVVTIGAIDDDPPSCPDASTTVLEDAVASPIVIGGCTDPDLLQIVTCAQETPPAERVCDRQSHLPQRHVYTGSELLRQRFLPLHRNG